MPEAVFTLEADIVPQLNTREVENQAQALSRQLNTLISKQTDKIGLRADSGSFNDFKNKLLGVSKATDVFHKSLNVIPKTLNNVAKTGKSAFLAFTDAVNITRRDMVGFGGSILDTIRNTNRFVSAIDDIRNSGAGLADLPRGIEQLVAQVRSGTSVLDQAALAGDRFAQFLQPVAATGAASQKELSGLNSAIQSLIGAVQQLGTAVGKTGSQFSAGFKVDALEKAQKGLDDLLSTLPAGSVAFQKFDAEIRKAKGVNTVDAVTKALVDAKNAAQTITGPFGRILQALGQIDEADRKTAIGFEQGLIKQLNEIGRSDLLTRIERINLALRNLGESAVKVGKGIQTASESFLKITHLEAPVGKLVASFDTLASGLVTKLRTGFQNAGAGIGSSVGNLGQTILKHLDTALAPVAGRVGKALGSLDSVLSSAVTSSASGLGKGLSDLGSVLGTDVAGGLVRGVQTGLTGLSGALTSAITSISGGLKNAFAGSGLGTNLVRPLIDGFKTLGVESIRLGADIVGGLRTGMTNSIGILGKAVSSIKEAIVGGLRRLLRSHSDAGEGIDIGKDFDGGVATGVNQNLGLITKAMGGVLGAIKAPLKGIKDVISTALRASIGKGPAEGVGAIGKAAGAALTPVRLFAQAVGPILRAGLQLTTAALKVAGVAFTGFLGAAVATGVQFNSLQAVVRATLPVILGSAEATNKLLAQVNDLNDTSPFARSSFLELTRVLAGFGIQAEKIVPLIDAIQQAVAATGGGEQDLLDLGQAFARLQSQGRLSLDIIQSFSSRGIDVIAILGQEFKKTQGEIRDMISNGLIPANKAIDALTKGLKEKFDGATAAVAKNLPGALDRVRAKTRDFGAELTRAFVSPTGGGAVVDLLNSFATIVDKITKSFLPLLRPALDAVAEAITNISGKAAAFVKTLGSFEAGKLKEFVGGLGGLVGPLAALSALLPGIISVVPVIGPLFAQLFSGIPTATLAITAFLLTLKPVRDAIGNLAQTLAPLGETLLPKISNVFKTLGDAIGPFVAIVLNALGPVLKAAGDAFGVLLDQMGPIIESIGKLLESLSPTIDLIKALAVEVLNNLGQAFKTVGPFIKDAIDTITGIINALQPVIDIIKNVLGLNGKKVSIDVEVNAKVKAPEEATGKRFLDAVLGKQLSGWIDSASKATNGVLEAIAGVPPAVDPLRQQQDAVEAATRAVKDQLKAAVDVGDAFADAYGKAKKASDDANAAVGNLTDQVKQQMGSFQGLLDPLIEAGKAVKSAHAAQADASKAAAAADANVTKTLQEQARALRDVISPTDELAAAQRGLVRTQNDLINLDRQEAQLKQQLKDLQGQDTADKRAALDRGVERAKIALNKARQDEIDLLNKSNAAQTISGNLEGLSLDQIKSRLSLVRLNLKSQKEVKTPTAKADEQTSAKLDTADAEQALKDSIKARAQFELDTTNQIRDTEEQIQGIEADRLDKRLEETNQLNHIVDLRKGETAQQAVIKDFEEKIKTARAASEAAAKAVTTAVTASAIAELELKAKAAGVNGEYAIQWGYQQQINALKQSGLTFDEKTEESLKRQSGTVTQIIADLSKAQTDADKLAAEAKKAAVGALGARTLQKEALDSAVKQGATDAKTVEELQKLVGQIKDVVTNVSTLGGIVKTQFGPDGKVLSTGESVTLNSGQIQDILAGASDQQAFHPEQSFRDILKEILKKIGLSIPGFAAGYAPGEIHAGMNNGIGLARMFEFGKEAVLPLTRKFDMARIVNNPSVLPGILDALPRWSLPSVGSEPVTSLGSIRDSNLHQGGPANADVYRRKEQRDFAGTVGSAVKTAIKEALSESGGSLGADIDINLHPITDNHEVIAREVKRQIEKLLGG